jgi:hypothetical protein
LNRGCRLFHLLRFKRIFQIRGAAASISIVFANAPSARVESS